MLKYIKKSWLGLSICMTIAHAQSFTLPLQWKIALGDQARCKSVRFDDSSWENIQLNQTWESQLFPDYNGYAWYRLTFDIPRHLHGQELLLNLGIIDDADETFFNGERVGQTGKMPPNFQSSWDKERKYKIPSHLVKSTNTIAVRVYDGNGTGGMCKGAPILYPYFEYLQEKENRLKDNHSYDKLTSSNGLLSVVYDAKQDLVEAAYPHIFTFIDSAQTVEPFMTNIKSNLKSKPLSVQYKNNTHIIEVNYPDLTLYYFGSFTQQDKTLYIVAKGKSNALKTLTFTGKINNPQQVELSQVITEQTTDETTKYFMFSYYDSPIPKGDSSSKKALNISDLVWHEENYMREIIANCVIPPDISTAERNVVEQGISVLKMSQVSDKEIFPYSHGQVLASLRPGSWAITWVRDGAYAISAMSKLGLHEEARKALEFMLKAPSNRFKNYTFKDGKNYGPRVDYQISLTRYFGNGKEECDFNEQGPNIEFDGWGLFLMALYDYISASNDWEFYKKWQPIIQTKVADPIVHIIQADGLLQQDSGPWEHHLPGRQYAWTSGICGAGLKQFAKLQQAIGSPYQEYQQQAQRIYQGIMDQLLVDRKYIKGNKEDQKITDRYYFDGGSIELFAQDFINQKELFLTHMKMYDEQLKVKTIYGKNRGYIRFNSQDSYENQEWPFAGLRVAIAQTKFGSPQKAQKIIARITDIAQYNYNLIPEILGNEYSEYTGSIPMVGYGSGAYILALYALHEKP